MDLSGEGHVSKTISLDTGVLFQMQLDRKLMNRWNTAQDFRYDNYMTPSEIAPLLWHYWYEIIISILIVLPKFAPKTEKLSV